MGINSSNYNGSYQKGKVVNLIELSKMKNLNLIIVIIFGFSVLC